MIIQRITYYSNSPAFVILYGPDSKGHQYSRQISNATTTPMQMNILTNIIHEAINNEPPKTALLNIRLRDMEWGETIKEIARLAVKNKLLDILDYA